MAQRLFFLCLFALTACGANDGTSVSDSTDGFVARSAAFTTVTTSDPNYVTFEQGFIVLSSSPNICADYPAGVFHRNMTFMTFTVQDTNALANTVSFSGGVYPVNDQSVPQKVAVTDANATVDPNAAVRTNTIQYASTGSIAVLDGKCKYEQALLPSGQDQALIITNLVDTQSANIQYKIKTTMGDFVEGKIKAVACDGLLDIDTLNGLKGPVGTLVCAP